MAKTIAAGSIDIPGVGTFTANAVPDPFDARDLEYRPKLQALPPIVDQRAGQVVLHQVGQSCTGHALAAVINTVLAHPAPPAGGGRAAPRTRAKPRVSPYMLYRLARRYDEFPGETDAGSSLRGAFKGWFHHGAALEDEWPRLDMATEPDLDDDGNLAGWRARPLGAFYRVNPYRLDDVQSAITELYAIAVSAVIHDGWARPVVVRKGKRQLHVIQRPVDAKSAGGHAFALVGYNEVGFLVQNSWGTGWGKDGFATLPYEDWFDSVYDAWVARPGVPHTPFYSGRSRTQVATGGELATGAGPDLRRLAMHVVNLGNDGRLSSSGKFVSTPAQVDRALGHMEAWHDFWLAKGRVPERHVMLYAHGGGVDERSGLEIAQRQLNWWLNNSIYPISFVWQSGPVETLVNQLVDTVKDLLPFGGLGFDLVEQFDRMVEGFARSQLRWGWDEMKENARAASLPIADPAAIQWPPTSSAATDAMAAMPGASLLVDGLARYVERHDPRNVRIHLAGHSAGSIFHAALLDRLANAGLAVDTMSWMAPGITVDEFAERALPHIGPGKTVRRFTCFNLSDRLELDDDLGLNGFTVYHKSILYLVSRAFERPVGGATEVPLVGLTRSWDQPFRGSPTLRAAVEAAGGSLVVSRSSAPVDGRTDATGHAAFDEDSATMTSLAMRARGATSGPDRFTFQAHAALNDAEGAPWSAGTGAAGAGAGRGATADRGPIAGAAVPAPARAGAARAGGASGGRRSARAAAPAPRMAEAMPAGAGPLEVTAEPQTQRPAAPRSRKRMPTPEVAVAPRLGSPILDVLDASGWKIDEKESRS